jgi:hypothetical protein
VTWRVRSLSFLRYPTHLCPQFIFLISGLDPPVSTLRRLPPTNRCAMADDPSRLLFNNQTSNSRRI